MQSRRRILILLIFLVCIASACGRSNVSEIADGNENNSDGSKIETNSSVGSTTNGTKELIVGSDKKQLDEEDFEIVYNSMRINPNTKVDDITKQLGFPDDYEANNQGYISGNDKYRRWNLCYPSYDKPEIRIIILSERIYKGEEVKDGNSYIVGIYLESYETQNGLKVGDEIEKVLQLFGKPETIENDIYRYSKGNLNIEVIIDDAIEKVQSIFIDYNMEKSIKEQEGANN